LKSEGQGGGERRWAESWGTVPPKERKGVIRGGGLCVYASCASKRTEGEHIKALCAASR